MMTRALILSGCFESTAWHNAHKTPDFNDAPNLIAFHRSLPHSGAVAGRVWPDLIKLRELIETAGYLVRPIMMVRDWHATIKSQDKREWFTEDAPSNIRGAIREITTSLPDFTPVTYEAFCLNKEFRKVLFTEYLNLPTTPIDIWYANDKYYGGRDD